LGKEKCKMTEKIKDFVEHELKMLDRGIVATPTEDYLENFSKANNGSNDFLLMQMAKNLGYKIALLNMKDRFYE
jgi:hypothetical protein